VLEDLGSKNGTRLNGERVRQGALKEGDSIDIYDWRMDVRLAARQLGEKVQQWKRRYLDPEAKVTLITHSLGGLVARYYVERLGGKEHVERLVMMGIPSYGVVGAFLTLLQGFEMPLGIMQEKATEFVRSWPAPYQILATYPGILDSRGKPINILEDDRWLPRDCLPLLHNARAFLEELGHDSSVPLLWSLATVWLCRNVARISLGF